MRHESRLNLDETPVTTADPAGYIYLLTHSQSPGLVRIGWQRERPDRSVYFLDDSRGITARPMELRSYGGYPHARQSYEQLQRRLSRWKIADNHYRLPLSDAVIELGKLSEPGAMRLMPYDHELRTKLQEASRANSPSNAYMAARIAEQNARERRTRIERRVAARRVEDAMPLIGLISWLVVFSLMESWVVYKHGLALEPVLTATALTAPASCLVAIGITRFTRWILRQITDQSGSRLQPARQD